MLKFFSFTHGGWYGNVIENINNKCITGKGVRYSFLSCWLTLVGTAGWHIFHVV